MPNRKPLIECVRDDILTFPGLDENGCLSVDFLGGEAVEYAVEQVPCDPVFRRYTDGGLPEAVPFYIREPGILQRGRQPEHR